jgi:DNA-binding transcriptional LysR family regulator
LFHTCVGVHWDKLKTFYYIAKMGNITKAAEFLRFSQSALSKSLKILEDRLQTRLFYRGTGGLQLTEKGEGLLKIVEKCYLEMQQVKEIMNEDNRLQGNLKVNLSPEISSFFLLFHLAGFFRAYPAISLSVEETDHILPEGNVLIHPFIKEREDLIQHPLTTITYGLYASQTYLDQFGNPQTLEDLKDHQLISSKVTNSLFSDIAFFEMTRNQEGGKLLIEINSVPARIQLAIQGLGIIAAPKDHPTIKQVNLIQILPDIPNPKLEIYYIYPKQFEPLKRIKALGEYLKTKLNEES